MTEQARRQAMELEFWDGPVAARALPKGLANHNFLVDDGTRRYMMRIGDDRPAHALFRYNEIAVSLAAHDAGLSPALLHHEPGALIFDYLTDTVSLDADDLG
jgi:hypothetical protein